jgi:hypothetical protein
MGVWRQIVYGGQWLPTVLLPVWWFAAPGSFQPGWAAILMVFLAPLMFLMSLVPTLISSLNRANRAAGTVPSAYAITCIALWVLAFVFPATIDGASDAETFPSIASSMGMPWAASATPIIGILWFAAWIVAIITATQATDESTARPPTEKAPGVSEPGL